MSNILSIGLDYLMLKDDKVRGDVRDRQLVYAQKLASLDSIVYSPKSLGFEEQKWADNLCVYPTNSISKATFILDAYRIASRIIKGKQIDAITVEDPFSTGVVGLLIKRKFKIPLNAQIHSDFSNNPYWVNFRLIHRIYNVIGKIILRRADTIRVGTNVGKKALLNMGIDGSRISVIPVNLDINKFRKGDGSSIREEIMKDKFDNLVFFAGRLTREKDIPTLLNAFSSVIKSLPRTLLVIAGSGYEEMKLKDISIRLGLNDNIIFLGNIDHNRIPDYLDACDVYVVSSLYEGTCIAMAEAMSAKKPVVVTRFSGAEDLVEDGKTGFKVNIRDHKTMADKIIYALNNKEEMKKIGENAAAKVESVFADNRNIDRVIELWEKTAEAKCSMTKP